MKRIDTAAQIVLIPLSSADGQAVYDMLQEIPADENGYVNRVNGMSYEEYVNVYGVTAVDYPAPAVRG